MVVTYATTREPFLNLNPCFLMCEVHLHWLFFNVRLSNIILLHKLRMCKHYHQALSMEKKYKHLYTTRDKR